MLHGSSGVLLWVLIAGSAQSLPQASPESRLVERHMSNAGLSSLQEMRFGGREVHQVLPIDAYGILPIPGVELERHRDGRLTLRLRYRGWADTPYDVSQEDWDRLAALEKTAFAPVPPAREKGNPMIVVHCTSGMIASTRSQARGWWACNPGDRPAMAYNDAVLDLAMKAMGCKATEKEAIWRFSTCTAAKAKLDNPIEQAKLEEFRRRWDTQREPGSDILARARMALRAAQQTPTEALRADAYHKIMDFGRQQQALRGIIQESGSGLPDPQDSDAKTQAIVSNQLRQWSADVEGQNRNYIDLLESYAALPIGQPVPQS